MLREAVNHYNKDNVHYQNLILNEDSIQDFLNNGNGKGCYNFIYCIGVFGYHINIDEMLIRNVFDYLKAGGVFFCSISTRNTSLKAVKKCVAPIFIQNETYVKKPDFVGNNNYVPDPE